MATKKSLKAKLLDGMATARERANYEMAKASREELTKRGVIIDTGERRDGNIVWGLNPNLTMEQMMALALADLPDTTH
jgi:hypothetical protein